MKRIGVRLWFGMMLLVSIVLILLWLFQIVFLDRFYQTIRISSLEKRGMEITASLEEAGSLSQGLTQAGLQSRMESFAYTNQISIDIIDQSQKTLYEADYSNSRMMGRGMMMNLGSEAAAAALSGETVKQKTQHPRFGTEYMLIGLPISISDTIAGAMLLTVPLAPVEDTVEILKQQLFFITLILIAVTVLISFYLSRSFTKPILKLHKLAESYSEGSFDKRVKIKQKDELGLLAERMNHMGEELAQNEQLRKDLIANVSHELRTPLSLIRGYAETLRDVTGDNPVKREKQLGVIIDETERLTRIVEDILSLSQFQAGKITLDQKSFSLNHMLTGVIQRYETAGLPRELFLVGDTDKEIFIIADQGRIEQVLYNLINNAIHHTEEGGRISIRTIDGPETARIEIADNGKGIPKEELPKVFDRYYRGKKEERSKNGGTGLGLAIVKSILQMHQVPFGVQSQLGVGTTFWFELQKDNSHTSF